MEGAPTMIVGGANPAKNTTFKKGEELQEGLKTVQQATVADQNGDLEEAVQLYSLALELFQTAAENTNDEAIKGLIKKKAEGYISRMESLRLKLLQTQFPEVPTEPSSAFSIDDLEKQFAETPVGDSEHYYNLDKQLEQETKISLVKEEGTTESSISLVKTETPLVTPEVNRETKNETPNEPPSYNSSEGGEDIPVGPQNPEVVQGIEEAAKWINLAKEDEEAGDIASSVANYKKGLTHLYRAYEKEGDVHVKELVRVKYNVLVSRMEEMENSLEDSGPKGFTPSTALSSSMGVIQQYTTKARELADNFKFEESVKYYNMAMTEIKKTMAREEVDVAKKWLAKRALVTQRRIGGISCVLKVVRVALPYPWSKIFKFVELGLKFTGVTGAIQNGIDKKLSKMAGIDEKKAPVEVEQTIDLAKKVEDHKKKRKSKKEKSSKK